MENCMTNKLIAVGKRIVILGMEVKRTKEVTGKNCCPF
jgi:hypothetical protein